jgi:hypothetical protein
MKNQQNQENQVTDAEVVDIPTEKPTAVELRHPSVPTSLDQLAALKGEAVEVIEARAKTLETLRLHSIRATSPEDWLLFKSPDGGETAYLQDSGADRVRDLWGIEIFDISNPQKIAGSAPDEFFYIISGSGHCKISKQTVENMEGGRSSTDDFCAGKSGVHLDLEVRKAARANLDGGITRELAGLKNVPVQELRAAWTGTNKTTDRCRLGKGYGTRQERAGGRSASEPDVEAPICEICGGKMNFIPAGKKRGSGKEYPAFWSCPKGFGKNPEHEASTIPHSEHLKNLEAAKPKEREPGEDG